MLVDLYCNFFHMQEHVLSLTLVTVLCSFFFRFSLAVYYYFVLKFIIIGYKYVVRIKIIFEISFFINFLIFELTKFNEHNVFPAR